MLHFDVFNGDADGLCALHQLRLAEPRCATLVTGTKRDVSLLRRVPCDSASTVTVLDVSLDQNRDALLDLLHCGAQVEYFDHHFAGDVPAHAGLRAHIDTAAEVCTSILVDRHLAGRHRVWAVVGAYGDNLGAASRRLGATLELAAHQHDALRELGESLNYNAYVDDECDLIIHPANLYASLHRHTDPFCVMEREPVLRGIRDTRRQDMDRARTVAPYAASATGRVYLLPDAAWSRRVRGAWGNALADAAPDRAHALLVPNRQGGYVASVRAPLSAMQGADSLCRGFSTGGGRAAAAGINHLPPERLEAFVQAFRAAF